MADAELKRETLDILEADAGPSLRKSAAAAHGEQQDDLFVAGADFRFDSNNAFDPEDHLSDAANP